MTVLKFAVTMVLRTTGVAPAAGNVAVTAGSTGLGACYRPQPATRATNTSTTKYIFSALKILIIYSCSPVPSRLSFDFMSAKRFESFKFPSRVVAPTHQSPNPPKVGNVKLLLQQVQSTGCAELITTTLTLDP